MPEQVCSGEGLDSLWDERPLGDAMITSLEELGALYDRIPETSCRPGCGECCGIVIESPIETCNITAYLVSQGRTPARTPSSWRCPYLTRDKMCSIYPARPLICRLFAATEDPGLQCPHGCTAERPLSATETRALVEELYGEDLLKQINARRERILDGRTWEEVPQE